jgi:hypothetical protein
VESERKTYPDIKNRTDTGFFIIGLLWTTLITGIFIWDFRQQDSNAIAIARYGLEDSFNKDTVYRYWASIHGGVYVPVTDYATPNPYLSHISDRDVTTNTGKRLTLINPAYMTRQVHELSEKQFGHKGHITSLKPLRPENAPDDWERKVLKKFEENRDAVCSVELMGDETYLRFMRPFVVDNSCLKCHSNQGYKVGDIRGGISISTPWKPIERTVLGKIRFAAIIYSGIWFVGIAGLLIFRKNIQDNLSERKKTEEEKSNLIFELQNSLARVKKLGGLLPICSSCKKIRDDTGYWHQVEKYVRDHSEAEFSHSICPDCMRKLYPDFADNILGAQNKDEKK